MRYLASFFLILCAVLCVTAQEAVSWSYKLVDNNTDHPAIVMTANIHPGYHLYDINNPVGGSNPLVFSFETVGCKISGKPVANVAYTKEYDEDFEVDQYFYTGTVSFKQAIIPTAPDFTISVDIKGQACNDKGCTQVYDSYSLKGSAPIVSDDTDKPEKEDIIVNDDITVNDSVAKTEDVTVTEQKETPSANNQPKITNTNTNQSNNSFSVWYVLTAAILAAAVIAVIRNKTVKIVAGFLELAVMVKLLSIADLAMGWHIIDREVFLALWIIIFTLLGLFLLGKLRLPKTDNKDTLTVTRFMLAVASLVFALYMLPGLWGAPLKSISSLTPPITTQDFTVSINESGDTVD